MIADRKQRAARQVNASQETGDEPRSLLRLAFGQAGTVTFDSQ
jgi:hypothetical protein